jgi:hypothetical protein
MDGTNKTDEDSKGTAPLELVNVPITSVATEAERDAAVAGGDARFAAAHRGPTGKASAVLVQIRRTTVEDGGTPEERAAIEELLANGPLIQLPYESGAESQDHWSLPGNRTVFEVPAIVADAAVRSGFFRAV